MSTAGQPPFGGTGHTLVQVPDGRGHERHRSRFPGDSCKRVPARALEQRLRLDPRDPCGVAGQWRPTGTGGSRSPRSSRTRRSPCFPASIASWCCCRGNGMRLRFDDGEVNELHPPHDRMRFAGERAVTGELLDGPTQDFNLMWRRDRDRCAAAAPAAGRADGVLRRYRRDLGRAPDRRAGALSPTSPAADDLARATPRCWKPAARAAPVLEGGGEVLLVRLRRAAVATATSEQRRHQHDQQRHDRHAHHADRHVAHLRPRAHIQMPDRPSSNMPIAKLSARRIQPMPPPTPLCRRLNAASGVVRVRFNSAAAPPGAYSSDHASRRGAAAQRPLRLAALSPQSRSSAPSCRRPAGPCGSPARPGRASRATTATAAPAATAHRRGSAARPRSRSLLSPCGQAPSPKRWFITSPVKP